MSTSIPNYVAIFAMEAQADATHCCIIVILFVQLSLEKGGVIEANMAVLPLPVSALS